MRALLLTVLACAMDPVVAQEYFHGYECTEDCSGHEAGYEWAEENDIDDPDDCGGYSQSFIEGCQAWAEENGDWSDDEACEDEDEDGYDDEEGDACEEW